MRRVALAAASVLLVAPGAVALSAPATASAPTRPTPGFAVRGFLNALEAGDRRLACAYVTTPQRAGCVSDLASYKRITLSGYAIGRAAVKGDRAIVTFTTTGSGLCFDGTCVRNSNPSAGQPSRTVSFERAASRVDSGGTPQLLTARVGGNWFVTQ